MPGGNPSTNALRHYLGSKNKSQGGGGVKGGEKVLGGPLMSEVKHTANSLHKVSEYIKVTGPALGRLTVPVVYMRKTERLCKHDWIYRHTQTVRAVTSAEL